MYMHGAESGFALEQSCLATSGLIVITHERTNGTVLKGEKCDNKGERKEDPT